MIMKESVAYKIAQCSVLNDHTLKDHEKLTVLRVLMEREDLALFVEKEEAKENAV
jgi:hypothetical protein